MKKIIFIITFLSSITVKGQNITLWEIPHYAVSVGGYTAGQIENFYDLNGNKINNFVHLSFYPRVGIKVSNAMVCGGYFLYGKISGNIHPNFEYYGVGPFVRYYLLPQRKVNPNLKQKAAKNFYYERVKLFTELSFLKTSYYYSKTQIYPINKLENNVISIHIGTNVRIWKQATLELAWRGYFFPTSSYEKFVNIRPLLSLGVEIYTTPFKSKGK